jgi:hypothetical protein
LRIYPVGGTVAIDAFVIDRVTVEPTLPLVEPTVEPPTIVPPIPTPLPMPVPFADAFDSGTGWTPTEAWRLGAALQGMGWLADSAQRDQASTLTYGTQIDLRGAAYPQLSVWQKAILTGDESLAVEISLDGGLSWFIIDQQTGLITDWAPHSVDLSAYRGAVIGLRFTLSAFGPVPEGMMSVGYWLDDLAILDLPPVPTVEPTVEPTTVPSTVEPTIEPTVAPPTVEPTVEPTAEPTEVPTEPTPIPTEVERVTT